MADWPGISYLPDGNYDSRPFSSKQDRLRGRELAWHPLRYCYYRILYHFQHLPRQKTPHGGRDGVDSSHSWVFRRSYSSLGPSPSKLTRGRIHHILQLWGLGNYRARIHGWLTVSNLHSDWSRLCSAYVRRDQGRVYCPPKSHHMGCSYEWFLGVCDGYHFLLHLGKYSRYYRLADWLSFHPSFL